MFSTAQQSSVTLGLSQVGPIGAASGRFCRQHDKLCHFGISQMRRGVTLIGAQKDAVPLPAKAKKATDFSVAPGLYPPQSTPPNSTYCNIAYPEQVAFTVVGGPFCFGLTWITASSLAQKPRTPLVLNPPGELPTVKPGTGAPPAGLPIRK